MDIFGDTLGTVVTIDTGMGSLTFSADGKGDSALDKVDGSTVCFSMYYCGSAYNASYNDGDEVIWKLNQIYISSNQWLYNTSISWFRGYI